MRSSFPFVQRRSFGTNLSLDEAAGAEGPSQRSRCATGPDGEITGRTLPAERAIGIGLAACAVDTALQFFLYFRASPSGVPFAMDPYHYVFHAAYYGAWAIGLATLPFLALAALRVRAGREPSAWTELLQASMFAAFLLVGSVDRECQRFLGMHISASWVQTYGALHRTPTVIWDTLQQDKGGAYSALLGVAVSLLYIPLSLALVRLVPVPAPWKRKRPLQLACALLLVWPTILWNFIPGGGQRQAKVRPALFLVWREATLPRATPPSAEALRASTAAFQKHWRDLDATHAWEFASADYPLRKRYVGMAPAPERRPNIILLSLETFRAKDMRSMNPALEVAPTPFLDSLARASNSAYFERYYTNGIPTVYAFIAMHASLLPHPRRGIHNEATTQNIEAFPSALRKHGYRALHFTGSDPDWDSQRVWLTRWYDEVHFSPADKERDRAVFRRALDRLRSVGREGTPFFASVSSITNHTPFRNPEPALDISQGGSSRDQLHNTMHYTDDVVRELYEGLKDEPWFKDTLWIITGDHGFDLGDRGESGSHENLRHESIWVPLILHGDDVRLPHGKQTDVGSHLDLAPTIAELASVWDDNSYMGHSLLHPAAGADALAYKGESYAYETREMSVARRGAGSTFVYAGADLEQKTALPLDLHAALLAESQRLADHYARMVMYTVDFDRVAPRPAAVDESAPQMSASASGEPPPQP
jgi:phosphoglycerol transferase MdoB-like AlkP superfamily enzyme